MATGPEAFRQLIDGRPGGAAGGETLDSLDPSTGRVWATIPRGRAADVDAAVEAARRALPGWRARTAAERAAALRRVGDLVAANAGRLAAVESRDNGRLLSEVTHWDVPACAQMWHYFAGAADKVHGETIEVDPAGFAFTRREAVGVVAVIIPWNAPLSLFSAKVAAALAAGNTVVVKPAEQASCSVLALGELLVGGLAGGLAGGDGDAAPLPPGVLNIVPGLGDEAGDALARHSGVARITFTGSTATARRISAAAAGSLTQLAFELGGKSPNIVFADADLDRAAFGVSTMALFTGNAGQTCIAGSRLLIEASIYDELLARVETAAAGVVLGAPDDPATTMGPIVSAEQLERVRSYIDIGLAEGAELAFGGRSGAGLFSDGSPLAGGYYVEPTLFRNVDPSMRIAREEIFGPVGVAIPFRNEEEALALANDSDYGLAGGVWTSDVARAHRFVRDLEVGAVWVNTYRRLHWAVPFGGVKDSGYGRDSGVESVRENTAIKSAWIQLD
jgi:(Z)-2-((N-methylformamido)methylene)-5-hydroxybutyrolactone dehydrogenase